MRTYLPFVITGLLCTVITILITYLLWGSNIPKSSKIKDDSGLVEAASKGKSAVVFIFTLTTEDAASYEFHQTGSGVIISADGYIVTNYHVISGNQIIHVELNDHRQYKAELVGIDSTHDVALLKIPAGGLPFLEFGNVDSLLVGEQVLAVGNPYRLLSTVTSGIVSAKDRDIDLLHNATENFIQTDVPINMGNSGGALLNTKGQLMGLNVAMITVSGEYEGYSFAIPSNLVKKIAEDLRDYGSLQSGAIGMIIRPVSPDIAKEAGMSEVYGIVVDALYPDAAADKAGIQSLDILLYIDGHKIQSVQDFNGKLDLHRPGDILSIDLNRNGKPYTIKVKLLEPQSM